MWKNFATQPFRATLTGYYLARYANEVKQEDEFVFAYSWNLHFVEGIM